MDPARRRSSTNPLALAVDLDGHEEMPVSALCNAILREALKRQATALQLTRGSSTATKVGIECAGEWGDMMDLPGKMHNAIVNRLKVMGNLQIDRRLSQQGHIYALLNGKEIVIPISVRRMSNDFEAVTIELPQ